MMRRARWCRKKPPWLEPQDVANSLFADRIQQAIEISAFFEAALMHEQSIDADKGRPGFERAQEDSVRMVDNFQFGVRPEAEALTKIFRHNYPPDLINRDSHGNHYGICHWQMANISPLASVEGRVHLAIQYWVIPML